MRSGLTTILAKFKPCHYVNIWTSIMSFVISLSLSPATLSAPMPNQLGSRPPAPANLSLHKSMASHSITFSDKAVRPLRMPLSVPS
jgi:hypothetical protein